MSLTEAIRAADLPAILERIAPDCGARAGKRGRVKCVWRGGTDDSGNLFQVRSGQWKLHDFVTEQTWDAFDVLVQIGGMTKAQAAAELTGERAISKVSSTPKVRALEIDPPDFPDELLACLLWSRITNRPLWPVNGEQTSQQGRRCLELLAGWIAESLETVRETDE